MPFSGGKTSEVEQYLAWVKLLQRDEGVMLLILQKEKGCNLRCGNWRPWSQRTLWHYSIVAVTEIWWNRDTMFPGLQLFRDKTL